MNGRFPALRLPVAPPFAPMESTPVEQLPSGAGWQYEPKWDGFRCLAFRDARTVVLQSKAGEPLTRYFPETVMAVASLPHERFVLDCEIIVFSGSKISYDELMQRIHPSARKVAQLSAKTPATLLAFDLLALGDESLIEEPLSDRRKKLEKFFKGVEVNGVQLSPATGKRPEALGWLRDLEGAGLDGIMAKRKDAPYRSGEREGMVKLKPQRTCDCVIAGVRRAPEADVSQAVEGHATPAAAPGPGEITSLLLGLYDDEGLLHHVGTVAQLPPNAKKGLEKLLAPLHPAAGATDLGGFTGRQPPTEHKAGGHLQKRDYESLRPGLVCEVTYDRFTQDHFRHNPTFLRFRPDKKAAQCDFDQVRPPADMSGRGFDLIGL